MVQPAADVWQTVKIGDLCKVGRGSSPRPIKDQKYFRGGTIPWIKIADATKSGKYLYKTRQYVNEYGASFSRLMPKGSLIVAASGTLGYTQMLGVEGCIHDGWLYLDEFSDNVDRDFLYYLFKHRVQFFYNSAYGAAIQNVNTTILREMEISLPPITTQRKISAVLSAYDDLIENNTRRIAILEEMAQSLYREWFVHFRFPGYEDVQMVEVEGYGRVPEGWEAKTIEGVCDSIRYGYTAKAQTQAIGPKFLRITDIVPNLIDWNSVPYCEIDPKDVAKFLLQEGDVVVARTGATVGYAKRIGDRVPDTVFASYLVRMRPREDFSQYMLGLAVDSPEYRQFIQSNCGGAAQPSANAKLMKSYPITVPPSEVQIQFDGLVAPMVTHREYLQDKNANLRQTRDLLLPRLISGELDLSTLDIDVK